MAIITTDSQHYTNIAKTIREATNTEDEFYPYEMAEKIAEVTSAAKNDGIRAMWEALQAGGTQEVPLKSRAFTKETYKPLYDVKPTSCYDWSSNCPPFAYVPDLTRDEQVDIVELEKEQGIVFDFGSATTANYDRAFVGALFKRWNVIDISKAKNLALTFYGGYLPVNNRRELAPTRIERLICGETNVFATTAFQYAVGYEYIGFEGTIASSINLSWSPLCPESMKMAIMCLKDYSGTENELTYTIKFSDTCWIALEEDSAAPNGGTWENYVTSLGWLT